MLGVDERLVGGECPYFGCIPSKMILRGADAAGRVAAGRRSWPGTPPTSPTSASSPTRIRDEATDDWDDTVAVERLEGQGATFARGDGPPGRPRRRRPPARRGRRRDAHGGARSSVSTGTRPGVPPIDGLADARRSASTARSGRTARSCRPRPRRRSMVVIGGGVDQLRARPGLGPLRHARSPGRGRARGCSAARSPRPARCWPTSSSARASPCGTGVHVDEGRGRRRRRRRDAVRRQHRDRREAARRGRPHAQPRPRRARDRRARPEGHERLDVDEHMGRVDGRRGTACSPSATSPARGRSPTCRCGRRAS